MSKRAANVSSQKLEESIVKASQLSKHTLIMFEASEVIHTGDETYMDYGTKYVID